VCPSCAEGLSTTSSNSNSSSSSWNHGMIVTFCTCLLHEFTNTGSHHVNFMNVLLAYILTCVCECGWLSSYLVSYFSQLEVEEIHQKCCLAATAAAALCVLFASPHTCIIFVWPRRRYS
jgi:hypothetical protein